MWYSVKNIQRFFLLEKFERRWTEIRIDNEQLWEILIIEQSGVGINDFIYIAIFVHVKNLCWAKKKTHN